MDNAALRARIERLIESLEAQEPPDESLGTPELSETAAVRELVGLGPEAIPYLAERLQTEPAKVVAYLVLALGKLGDARVVESLSELRSTYQAREPKDEWDHAVIGQCNVAIEALAPPEKTDARKSY
jgi:HEAT repeat protein